jgi:ketosteroid isomerase-like protein
LTRAEIDAYVAGWIDAWNRRDIEAVLAHVADGKRSRVCEMLAFDVAGRVVSGEVMHGAEPA